MDICPIWKDYYVDLGTEKSVEYSVYAEVDSGSVLIFKGLAHRRPNEANIKIKINDICADYLEQQVFQAEEGFFQHEISVKFYVSVGEASRLGYVQMINDWSYEDKEEYGVLASSITKMFDVRMPLLYSLFVPNAAQKTIYIDAQDTGADFNIDFSSDFLIGNDRGWNVNVQNSGTLTLRNIFDKQGDVTIRTDNSSITYKGISSCATHALYYVNAYGGWDFMLMQGRTIEQDSYKRREFGKDYNNASAKNRGTYNYLNEVQKSFTLRTGWMFGNEGKQMHHLLGSTNVFLFDIEKQTMTPVIVTNGDCKYKTYGTEGGKLVSYEINVRIAQNRARR